MIVTHLNPIPTTILSVPTNKVHNHSQTRLNPQVFLEIKKSRLQRIFVETDTPDCKSVLQKYFGKKVLYATSRSDLVHTISFRKFVDEIKFSEGILEDYKCLSTRIFLGEPIEILCKKEYEKLISTSISKITMDFYNYGVEARALKSVRPFAKNIKHLNLRLPTSTRRTRGRRRGQSNNNFVDMEYLRIVELFFPMLDKLETFTLQFPSTNTKSDVNDDKYVQQMEAFLGFLRKIVKLKSLRKINIDLFKMGINCKFLKDLLLCLDTSHVEKWHFIGFLEEEILDVNTIGPLLEKIDFLGLKFTTSLNDRKWPDYMPPDLREMPELTAKRKKVLDLEMMYDDEGLNVELAEVLSYGKSLEGLYIKSLCQDRINWETTDLASLAQVKDLVLVWDEDQDSLDEFDDQFLKDFLSEFKKENSILRSLKIFFRNTYCDEENNFEERWTIPAYITDLQGMKSLEELTLYSDGEIYDGGDAGEAFDSLVNLKRLTLHLCASNNTSDWDDEFPFNNLNRLTEFRLIIHPDMQVAEWDESFAAHISLLPDLEVLEIIDKTEKKMSLCVLYNILKQLARFQNLRKLILQTYMKRFVSKETLFIVGQEFYQECELKVIEDIKGKILRLISANPMLEEMDIGDFEGYSISQAFYRKLMDKE